jgi:hypothetical protein
MLHGRLLDRLARQLRPGYEHAVLNGAGTRPHAILKLLHSLRDPAHVAYQSAKLLTKPVEPGSDLDHILHHRLHFTAHLLYEWDLRLQTEKQLLLVLLHLLLLAGLFLRGHFARPQSCAVSIVVVRLIPSHAAVICGKPRQGV